MFESIARSGRGGTDLSGVYNTFNKAQALIKKNAEEVKKADQAATKEAMDYTSGINLSGISTLDAKDIYLKFDALSKKAMVNRAAFTKPADNYEFIAEISRDRGELQHTIAQSKTTTDLKAKIFAPVIASREYTSEQKTLAAKGLNMSTAQLNAQTEDGISVMDAITSLLEKPEKFDETKFFNDIGLSKRESFTFKDGRGYQMNALADLNDKSGDYGVAKSAFSLIGSALGSDKRANLHWNSRLTPHLNNWNLDISARDPKLTQAERDDAAGKVDKYLLDDTKRIMASHGRKSINEVTAHDIIYDEANKRGFFASSYQRAPTPTSTKPKEETYKMIESLAAAIAKGDTGAVNMVMNELNSNLQLKSLSKQNASVSNTLGYELVDEKERKNIDVNGVTPYMEIVNGEIKYYIVKAVPYKVTNAQKLQGYMDGKYYIIDKDDVKTIPIVKGVDGKFTATIAKLKDATGLSHIN